MTVLEEKLRALGEAVRRYGFLMTAHADEEAREEDISLREIHEAIENGEIIEDYPTHRRGPCCLIYARVSSSRDIHLVVTTEKIPPRIITVYEPRPPHWAAPKERRVKR